MSEYSALITELIHLLGANHVRTGADAVAYHTDERNRYHHAPLAVLLPDTIEQIRSIVQLCAQNHIVLISQGGNTGLVGGCAVLPDTPTVILNLTRFKKIIEVDPLNHTLTVEAGATLAQVQTAAQAHGLLFPLSIASESNATIGGNLATNAGGVQVLRYGSMRDLCLGLEVVLANGEVLSMLNTLRKNNTGYDLKHLFIGSEGTLGIITRAVLKLYPRPAHSEVALLHAPTLAHLLNAFSQLRAQSDAQLTAFEMIAPYALHLVCAHLNCAHPWQGHNGYTALVEASYPHTLNDTLTQTLHQLIENHTLTNALIAQSGKQAEQFWQMREQISAAQKAQGKNIKHDISVPISAIGEFVAQTEAALQQTYAGIQPVIFGHIGDGNLHFNISAGTAFNDSTQLMTAEYSINHIIYTQVQQFNGSISAEHGIGLLKRELMNEIKSPCELAAMSQIKRALDPNNTFNPHKILP